MINNSNISDFCDKTNKIFNLEDTNITNFYKDCKKKIIAKIDNLEKELVEKNRWLFIKITEQKQLVVYAAQTEHDYRIALAKKIMELRTDGTAVTIIKDLSQGDKIIANVKLEREINTGMEDAGYR